MQTLPSHLKVKSSVILAYDEFILPLKGDLV